MYVRTLYVRKYARNMYVYVRNILFVDTETIILTNKIVYCQSRMVSGRLRTAALVSSMTKEAN